MLEYGDILYLMHSEMGNTLYMVAHHPVVCDYCKAEIIDWEYEEDGKLYCPRCGTWVRKFERPVCPVCGGRDRVTLVIAANTGTGVPKEGDYISCNQMVNISHTFCEKSVLDDAARGRIRICSPQESCERKRLLLWNQQPDFDPSKGMPDWIKERFPMPH